MPRDSQLSATKGDLKALERRLRKEMVTKSYLQTELRESNKSLLKEIELLFEQKFRPIITIQNDNIKSLNSRMDLVELTLGLR
jgi:hypothetical protein